MKTLLLAAAVICFVLEAFEVGIGTFRPKWWALGVACWVGVELA